MHLSRDPDDRPSTSRSSSLGLYQSCLSTTEHFEAKTVFNRFLLFEGKVDKILLVKHNGKFVESHVATLLRILECHVLIHRTRTFTMLVTRQHKF